MLLETFFDFPRLKKYDNYCLDLCSICFLIKTTAIDDNPLIIKNNNIG